jgi:hypothetical protein
VVCADGGGVEPIGIASLLTLCDQIAHERDECLTPICVGNRGCKQLQRLGQHLCIGSRVGGAHLRPKGFVGGESVIEDGELRDNRIAEQPQALLDLGDEADPLLCGVQCGAMELCAVVQLRQVAVYCRPLVGFEHILSDDKGIRERRVGRQRSFSLGRCRRTNEACDQCRE